MQFILKYFLLILILFLTNCASIGSPTGGEVDKTSPKLISIKPDKSTNIDDEETIELTFDERINSLYINRNIRIEPEMEVDIKVKNNEIKISPVLSWPNDFKIFISRKISDYHENILNNPIELFYTKADFIDIKKLKGQLFNIDNSKIYEVAIIDEDYSIISKTESDNLGYFTFSGIKNFESLFIFAIESKIKENFIDDIRTHNYGLSNNSLNYDFNPIYISEPIYRAKINNVNLLNKYYGRINMSNGDVIPFILNYNKFSDYIYTNSNYIYLESDINDSLFIDLNYENTIEKYNVNSTVLLNNNIQDTIKPFILDSYFSDDSLLFRFSEPILLNEDLNIFSYNEDSITIDIEYKYISPELIFLDSTRIEEININCLGIEDLTNNSLCDSVQTISKSSIDDYTIYSTLGTVNGNVIYDGNKNLVVEIINLLDNVTKKQFVRNNNFAFEDLIPGEYKIWVYEDLNNVSNSYFSGLLEPTIQNAAKFEIYPNQLTVRGNWSNTITIKLK